MNYCKFYYFYDFQENSITNYLGFMRLIMGSSMLIQLHVILYYHSYFQFNYTIQVIICKLILCPSLYLQNHDYEISIIQASL